VTDQSVCDFDQPPWQWRQLGILRDENGALDAKVRKLSVTTKMPPLSARSPESAVAGSSTPPSEKEKTAGPPQPGRTPEERARFQKMREIQRTQRIEARLLALTTKLNLPPVRARMLMRSRLIAHLDAALNTTVTLIAAPAGYGKTSLLIEWLTSRTEGRGLRTESAEDQLSPQSSVLSPYHSLQSAIDQIRARWGNRGIGMAPMLGR